MKIILEYNLNYLKCSYLNNNGEINLLKANYILNNEIIDFEDFEDLYKNHHKILIEMFIKLNINMKNITNVSIVISINQKESFIKFKNLFESFLIENSLNFDFKIVSKISSTYNYFKNYISNEPENYLLIDLNFNNVEFLEVKNSELNKNSIKGIDKGGKLFQDNLLKYIEQNYDISLSFIEVKELLKTFKILKNNEFIDLKEVIFDMKKKYTKYIIDFIIKNLNLDIEEYEKIIFSGDSCDFINFDNKIIKLKENEFSSLIGSII
jgi:hypothetical protein